MRNILVLKTSILGDNSVSNQLIDQFIAELPDHELTAVTLRDLGQDQLPQLDAAWLTALATDPAERNQDQQAMVARSDQLIEELQQADLVVIGAPMYNFSVPAGLKVWFDHVARAGITFKYTEQGPIGLLSDKQVVVFATMGGIHLPGESDHLRPYLKTMLNFLGLDEVEFVAVSGLNLGEEPRQRSLREAHERLIAVANQIDARQSKLNSSRKAA